MPAATGNICEAAADTCLGIVLHMSCICTGQSASLDSVGAVASACCAASPDALYDCDVWSSDVTSVCSAALVCSAGPGSAAPASLLLAAAAVGVGDAAESCLVGCASSAADSSS